MQMRDIGAGARPHASQLDEPCDLVSGVAAAALQHPQERLRWIC
jgi:hypothetical protein